MNEPDYHFKLTIDKWLDCEDGWKKVLMSNGVTFTAPMKFGALTKHVKTRYVASHYALDQEFGGASGVGGYDNLLNLELGSDDVKAWKDYRAVLLEKFPVKEGDTVLELGAFMGFGTMWLSDMVGPDGRVVAVEADLDNFNALVRNKLNNNRNNIKVVGCAISDRKSKMSKLYRSVDKPQVRSLKPWTGLLPEIWGDKPDNSILVDVNTGDDILKELGIDYVDYITLEINMSEREALIGLKNTLAQDNIRVTAAGWYHDDKGVYGAELIGNQLLKSNFTVLLGKHKRVYAFKNIGV